MSRIESSEIQSVDYFFSYPDGSVLAHVEPTVSDSEYLNGYLEYLFEKERLKLDPVASETGESLVLPRSIVNLGKFLVNRNVTVPIGASFHKRYRSSWKKAEDDLYVGATVWVSEISRPYLPPRSKILAKSTLLRASSLGLIGSIPQTERRFGNLEELYSLAGLSADKRVSKWGSYGKIELTQKLKLLAEELERTPRWDDIVEKSRADRTFPGPKVFNRVFGSMFKAQRASELLPPKDWAGRENYDFVAWGMKLAEANSGLLISERLLPFFRNPVQYGDLASPPLTTIVRRFGSFRNYQMMVAVEYKDKVETTANEKRDKLFVINELLASGSIPPELFDNGGSDESKISRYARFVVASEFFDDSMLKELLSIAKMSNGRLMDDGVVRALQQYFPHISAGEIQVVALCNGVFDEIWPPDKEYLETLRIPKTVITQRQTQFIV